MKKETAADNPRGHQVAKELGLNAPKRIYYNTTPEELIEETIIRGQGKIADSGALCIDTGEFTGRSPKDRFIVKDSITANEVNWGGFNTPFEAAHFDLLEQKILKYFDDQDVFIRDNYVCADEHYKTTVRTVTEYPWSNMFANNMFLRPSAEELETIKPAWTILCAPGFYADPAVDHTRQHNFSIIDFSRKKVLIGGSGYTGEIKKGIFTTLNFILPVDEHVFPMHCSANIGKDGDTAIFFGLSGTGKTTLSADPKRSLIGDDEHGWTDKGVFNFEGGCYAKTVNLSRENEPDIYNAIKHGAILENIGFFPGTRSVDFADVSITENTRVSYPMEHIANAAPRSMGGHPANIFFLTCDAFGVLPPISKLTTGQAMYHFISGYTAKVAGTEAGIIEPQGTFSACFGAPFLLLHPARYAALLGEKMDKYSVNVWLINTGWTGGPYGVGTRMKLKYTRAMISAALKGQLNNVAYHKDKVFGLNIPVSCPDVPPEILDPRNTWADKALYDQKANELANKFNRNFEQYADEAAPEIREASPVAG
ncbi:MAG TPA: phosphoenolpyruvate carboxykinase (ATP) [Saprospiraceae bacterium]|nr:phosphoenolpyruvate carboxykinase (ATP) [Saprospiraceae bacterium]HQW55943.1 phosphoenolpyruvate carboxykinase (ATP) [Saprospiraceae bacterium]